MNDNAAIKQLTMRVEQLESRLRHAEDIQKIHELKMLYCQYCDGGWDGQGPSHMGPVADLFVEDGVWDSQPYLPRVEGREALRQFFEGCRAVPFAIHKVMNPMIEIDGDEASGHWHVISCFTSAAGDSGWVMGIYKERYVRTAQGWRYKSIRGEIARSWLQPGGWGDINKALDPAGNKG